MIPDKSNNVNRLFTCIFLLLNICFIFPFPKAKLSIKTVLSCMAFCVSLLLCSLHVNEVYHVLVGYHFPPKAIAHMLMILLASFNRTLLSLKMESLMKIHSDLSTVSTRNRVFIGRRKYCCLVAWFTCSVALNVLILVVEICDLYDQFSDRRFTSQFPEEVVLQEMITYAYSASLMFFLLSPFHIFTVFYTVLCLQIRSRLKEFKLLLRRDDPADYFVLYKAYHEIEGKIHSADDHLNVFVFANVLFDAVMMYLAFTLFLHPEFFNNATERRSVAILSLNTIMCSVVMMTSAIGVNDESLGISREATHLQSSNVAAQLRFHSSIDKGINMSVWGMGHVRRSLFLSLLGTIFTYCILVDGIWFVKMSGPVLDDNQI